MTTYYVGKGGSDSNDGTTWALRKLTIGGVEALSLTDNDIVYVGPGVYREQWTLSNNGTSAPIVCIGDRFGENTDGVGGEIVITGSNDDQTDPPTRTNAMAGSGNTYRTFKGFRFECSSNNLINLFGGPSYMTFEDCVFIANRKHGLYFNGTQSNITVRRCLFVGSSSSSTSGLSFFNSLVNNDSNILVENCLFLNNAYHIQSNKVGGVVVKNCTFYGDGSRGAVRITSDLDTGQDVTVINCRLSLLAYGFYAINSGEIVEDYNCLSSIGVERTNVTPGSNSVSYLDIPEYPIIHSEYRFPYFYGNLDPRSPIAQIAGYLESSEDFHGLARPTVSSKKSWGAIQFQSRERETTITKDSSPASIVLNDADRVQFKVPVTAVSTTISVYVYREANYAGTLPQMIIREPGQSARSTTDTGSASTWNQLTDTFTPQSTSNFVIVELVSNNTATSGSYRAFFDDLLVS